MTEAEGWPAAVLIRALEPKDGIPLMRRRRLASARHASAPSGLAVDDLCRGPGNLTKALGIDLRQNLLDLTGSALRIEDRAARRARSPGAGASGSTSAWSRNGASPRPTARRSRARAPRADADRTYSFFDADRRHHSRPHSHAWPRRPTRSALAATVTILHFNDVYEITPVEAGKAGGLARVARFRAELKAQHPELITTLGGDYVSPSALGTARIDGEPLARPADGRRC